MRILLIEDHKATAETLTRLLKKSDSRLEVYSAGTLAEGIARSTELKADVTLLDLCLPDTKSWQETAAAIRRFHPPVIVITDLDGPEVVAECMKNGAQQVFSKRIAIKFISAVLSAISAARMRVIAAEQFGAGHDSTP